MYKEQINNLKTIIKKQGGDTSNNFSINNNLSMYLLDFLDRNYKLSKNIFSDMDYIIYDFINNHFNVLLFNGEIDNNTIFKNVVFDIKNNGTDIYNHYEALQQITINLFNELI